MGRDAPSIIYVFYAAKKCLYVMFRSVLLQATLNNTDYSDVHDTNVCVFVMV